jgi:VanZ family protein
MTLKRAFHILAAGWTLVIMGLCWIPASLLVESGGAEERILGIPLDKVIHFSIFLGFAILWHLAKTESRHSMRIVVGGIVLAILTEVVQGLPMIARQSDVDDAVFDIAGVLVGTLIMRRVVTISARKSAATLAETTA